MNTRMDRARLNIGAYFLAPYARDERHVREVAECGIDFIVCMDPDRPALDRMHRYGIGAIVTQVLPGWWGGDGDNAGKMEETNPISGYEAAAAAFEDHPAIWGIDAGDEPSALDFPYYGRVMDLVERSFPHQFAYLNLYPNYASVAVNTANETVNQLGTATYAEHIDQYCQHVGTDYICYDFYMYSASVEGAYENLRIVSEACLRTGRSMWIVLQVNSSREAEWITENQLRFQAYSALAFGAENIIWGCYTAGWWYNQVLDENGEKTQQYDKLKAVNAELRTLGGAYMGYRRVSTHFVGFQDDPVMDKVRQAPVSALNTGIFSGLREEKGGSLLVGQMVSRAGDGSYALMVCNAADPLDTAASTAYVRFKADGRQIRIITGAGEITPQRQADGSYRFPLPSCAGALVIAR